ncbi:hypothetical protein OIE62_00850 [Streptomyces scopuliridis]|uniref:Uncharacterized protein n=1 Tax=Streptomyces scopuliridis TaxID=452529 RepID=A0ACD4ZY72_9ACTN|nr:hypothetical protein [Streptomyces scopuliridis]WSB38304.1 hypothetical protein OG949_39460 [Streptomyces scopuliridis]WSC02743.1 hypothetical protein OG835_40985 [Streptomyces scopuliridis]WSC03724.1 hypothetical protein OIE62_00850 [Streptomyces scopuliridis]
MPNTPAHEEDRESTVTLVERIEANRHELTLAAAQTDECHDIASIFGWDY